MSIEQEIRYTALRSVRQTETDYMVEQVEEKIF